MVFLPSTRLNSAVWHRKIPFTSIAECELGNAECEIRNSPSGLSPIITPDYSAFCIGCSIRASFSFMTIFPPKATRFAAWLSACLAAAAFAEQKENFQIRVSGQLLPVRFETDVRVATGYRSDCFASSQSRSSSGKESAESWIPLSAASVSTARNL
jgi:hypothetical protein